MGATALALTMGGLRHFQPVAGQPGQPSGQIPTGPDGGQCGGRAQSGQDHGGERPYRSGKPGPRAFGPAPGIRRRAGRKRGQPRRWVWTCPAAARRLPEGNANRFAADSMGPNPLPESRENETSENVKAQQANAKITRTRPPGTAPRSRTWASPLATAGISGLASGISLRHGRGIRRRRRCDPGRQRLMAAVKACCEIFRPGIFSAMASKQSEGKSWPSAFSSTARRHAASRPGALIPALHSP